MQPSTALLRSMRWSSAKTPASRTFSSVSPSLRRSPRWPKELPYSPSMASFRRQIITRPFSSSPAFRQKVGASATNPAQGAKEEVPSYEMRFTCKRCMTPQTHKISKQGYHHGTVLVTCPGCKNRHLVADHLKIFSDKGVTLEDILREKGQTLKKGTLGADGDLEFWDDGTTTSREAKSSTFTEPSRLDSTKT